MSLRGITADMDRGACAPSAVPAHHWRELFSRRTLILASQSPRRRDLLDEVGVPHRVLPSNHDEAEPAECEPPWDFVVRAARQKAARIAAGVDSGLIVAADTVVVLDGCILGKPGDQEAARMMLRRLSGRTHDVYTGLALCLQPERHWIDGWERTKVDFVSIAAADIDAYVAGGDPLDKAGAYGIQGVPALWIPRIEGAYDTVVGLPRARLYQLAQALYGHIG